MSEVMIDLRKYDLADRLKVDMISVESLLNELENALDEIDSLKEQIKKLETPKEPDIDYDWSDISTHKPSWWCE